MGRVKRFAGVFRQFPFLPGSAKTVQSRGFSSRSDPVVTVVDRIQELQQMARASRFRSCHGAILDEGPCGALKENPRDP